MKKNYLFLFTFSMFFLTIDAMAIGNKLKDTGSTASVKCKDGTQVNSISECEENDSINLDTETTENNFDINDKYKLNTSAFSKEDFGQLADNYEGYIHFKALIKRQFDFNLRLKAVLKKKEGKNNEFEFKFYLTKLFTYDGNLKFSEQEYFTNKEDGTVIASGDLEFEENATPLQLKYSNKALKEGIAEYRRYLTGIPVVFGLTLFGTDVDEYKFDKVLKTYENQNIYGFKLKVKNALQKSNESIDYLLTEFKNLLVTRMGAATAGIDTFVEAGRNILKPMFLNYLLPIFNSPNHIIGFDKDNPDLLYVVPNKETFGKFVIHPIIFNKDIKYHLMLDPQFQIAYDKWAELLSRQSIVVTK